MMHAKPYLGKYKVLLLLELYAVDMRQCSVSQITQRTARLEYLQQ